MYVTIMTTTMREDEPLTPTGTLVEEGQDRISQEKPGIDNVTYKMGTFAGVFVPTTLNVLSILMFLRFGFILGQTGVLGIFALLLVSYGIDLLTTLSISAISTNGTVKGGGAYYMISRSLGPEFGGSIGMVFFVGQVLNSGLNVVGFCEPLITNFGRMSGSEAQILPEGRWWTFVYSSIVLALCTGLCTVGSSVFARFSKILFVILITATLSIPVSTLFVQPYLDARFDALYTGLSWSTLRGNLLPKFTKGAAGSQIPTKETFQDMFGIFFPATSGIFAGASMSGDLRKPSKSIPKGTLWGLLSTFILYVLVILSLGATVSRRLLYNDVDIIRSTNLSGYLIIMGEFSTSLFSALMGIVGSAKLLQAISKDNLLPYMGLFGKGSKKKDTPLNAIFITWLLTQLTLFFDINQIAVFITMAYLMTFVVTNLACFLLKIASAPNFRPSFRYFSWKSAALGALFSVIAMFIADGMSASAMIIVLIFLFLLIHYISPPKPWGDVSQSLIYHQVRKYLLRLRQDHVKYWRPQILLLIDNPRTSWNLIHFCNHLKKGGLYILGHVMVTSDFTASYPEIQRQQNAWLKLRDVAGIKAFVQVAAGPNLIWGARNLYMGSGLGGMKPNITVMGFFDLSNHPQYRDRLRARAVSGPYSSASGGNSNGVNDSEAVRVEYLPTDICRTEPPSTVCEWVKVIEDLLTMQATVAIARGFCNLTFPDDDLMEQINKTDEHQQRYIDLYPIQMSAHIVDESGEVSALSTNFDTYTLILQMGAILNTVPSWKRSHQLRIVVFVESEEDVEFERQRIRLLIDKLRITAEIVVLCLNNAGLESYEVIVNGKPDVTGHVTAVLKDQDWWQDLCNARDADTDGPSAQSAMGEPCQMSISPEMGRMLESGKKRRLTVSSLQRLGLNHFIQTHKLSGTNLGQRPYEDDDDSSDSSSTDYESDTEYHENQFNGSPIENAIPQLNAPLTRSQTSTEVTAGNKRFFMRRGSTVFRNPFRKGLKETDSAQTVPQLSISNTSGPATSGATTTRTENQDDRVEDPSVQNQATLQLPKACWNASTGSLRRPGLTSRNNSSSSLRRQLPNFSGKAIPNTRVSEDDSPGKRTIMFEDERSPLLSRNCSSLGLAQYTAGAGVDEQNQSSIPVSPKADNDSGIKPGETSNDDDDKVSFNVLPAIAQHVILNDLMQQTSRESAVIFSTLPAPTLGTCKSEEEAVDYIESLDIWCDGLPPIVLLHSQSMTVTTAL